MLDAMHISHIGLPLYAKSHDVFGDTTLQTPWMNWPLASLQASSWHQNSGTHLTSYNQ